MRATIDLFIQFTVSIRTGLKQLRSKFLQTKNLNYSCNSVWNVSFVGVINPAYCSHEVRMYTEHTTLLYRMFYI
jgi:hypothetical protein